MHGLTLRVSIHAPATQAKRMDEGLVSGRDVLVVQDRNQSLEVRHDGLPFSRGSLGQRCRSRKSASVAGVHSMSLRSLLQRLVGRSHPPWIQLQSRNRPIVYRWVLTLGGVNAHIPIVYRWEPSKGVQADVATIRLVLAIVKKGSVRIFRRLVYWWRFRTNVAEVDEELSFHRDAIERELIASGISPADARAATRRAMGNETLMREQARGVWLWPSVEAVWQDAKGTLRGLRKSPAFTAGVMLTFALGVGANAAMFSFLDRLMFRPPALMRDPATVHRVYLYKVRDGVERETGGQYARHADLARWTTSFSDVAAHVLKQLVVGVGQDAREMRIGVVSARFLDSSTRGPLPDGISTLRKTHRLWVYQLPC